MNLSHRAKIFSLLIGVLVLPGCKNPEEKAKELGFESAEQMKRLKERGYLDYKSYMEVQAFTAEKFLSNCKKAASDEYNSLCKGKRISWLGILEEESGFGGAEVKVISKNGNGAAVLFSIDSRSIAKKVGKEDVGKLIEFDGVVGEKNVVTPDVDEVVYVKIENNSDRDARVAKQKAEDKLKSEASERAAEAELAAHRNDAEWLQEKFGISAEVKCARGADEYLRTVARYGFKWDEVGWAESKFTQYYKIMKSPGVITISSNKISLQNGFGAHQRATLECDFNTKEKSVAGYNLV